MKSTKRIFAVSAVAFAAFALWTLAVCFADVRAVGPQNSSVGLAGINLFIHRLTGVNFDLYHITDWLGLIPIGVCAGFGLLGLLQWIKRKSIRKVDFDLLILGGFFLAVIAFYLLFETIPVNYRPVLIDGFLEVSYPSSTTLLTLCVMPAAGMQLRSRIKNIPLRRIVLLAITGFTAFMAVGRFLSGVHWFSDIIGGILLSAGLVLLYRAFLCLSQTHNSR